MEGLSLGSEEFQESCDAGKMMHLQRRLDQRL